MKFGNVLVTGGAGFLGSQLVKRLLHVADSIYIIDDCSTGKRQALPLDSDKIMFFERSIEDEQLLDEILPEVEWIFHLACRNLVQSVEDIHRDMTTNLFGGFTLLQKAKDHCPKLKHFIYTSTASIYGNASILPTPETYYRITLPYAASKFSMEHYCQVYYHLYKLPVTILRLSNVFGPGQLSSNPYCGVVSKFFHAIEQGDPITIYGDGTQTRDFTYLSDALDAMVIAAISPQAAGRIYNVGTGIRTNIHQLATKILQQFGLNDAHYPIQYEVPRLVDTVKHRVLDHRLINEELQWMPQVHLEAGLALTYDWFLEEKDKSP